MKALVAVYRVHWGFSSRAYFGSAVQPSYLLPPPATILGALAKALNDVGVLDAGEFTTVKGVVASGAASVLQVLGARWWVTTAWFSPAIRTGILIRYFTGPYQSHQTRYVDLFTAKKLLVNQLFAPLKLGYTLSPHGKLAVLIALEDGDADAVKRGLVHVSRMGSKESFVDLLALYEASLTEDEAEGTVVTPWLTLLECVESLEGNYVLEKTPIPLTADELLCLYSAEPCTRIAAGLTRLTALREAIHPRYPGWTRVQPRRDRCVVFKASSLTPVLQLDAETDGFIRYMLARTRVLAPRGA